MEGRNTKNPLYTHDTGEKWELIVIGLISQRPLMHGFIEHLEATILDLTVMPNGTAATSGKIKTFALDRKLEMFTQAQSIPYPIILRGTPKIPSELSGQLNLSHPASVSQSVCYHLIQFKLGDAPMAFDEAAVACVCTPE